MRCTSESEGGGRISIVLSISRPSAQPPTPEDIHETAEMCVVMFEAQGKPIEGMLSEINSEGGGWLLPADVPKVREAARRLMMEGAEGM